MTRGAGIVLDRLEVPNLRMGVILELADRQWVVDEAASGADAVLLVLAVTLFCALSARCSSLSIIMLLAAALCWAVVAGVVDVASVAYLAARRGVSLSRGWPTALPRLVAIAATLALVLSTDRLLSVLGAFVDSTSVTSLRRARIFGRFSLPYCLLPTAYCLLVCGSAALARWRFFYQAHIPRRVVAMIPESRRPRITSSTRAAFVADHSRVRFAGDAPTANDPRRERIAVDCQPPARRHHRRHIAGCVGRLAKAWLRNDATARGPSTRGPFARLALRLRASPGDARRG